MSGDEWARVAGPQKGGSERQEPPEPHGLHCTCLLGQRGPHWGKGRAEMMPLLLGQSPLNSPLTARHSELQWKPT